MRLSKARTTPLLPLPLRHLNTFSSSNLLIGQQHKITLSLVSFERSPWLLTTCIIYGVLDDL